MAEEVFAIKQRKIHLKEINFKADTMPDFFKRILIDPDIIKDQNRYINPIKNLKPYNQKFNKKFKS